MASEGVTKAPVLDGFWMVVEHRLKIFNKDGKTTQQIAGDTLVEFSNAFYGCNLCRIEPRL